MLKVPPVSLAICWRAAVAAGSVAMPIGYTSTPAFWAAAMAWSSVAAS